MALLSGVNIFTHTTMTSQGILANLNPKPLTVIARPPITNRLPVVPTRPVILRPPTINLSPVPTIQNLGQQYEFQTYNSDGSIRTVNITALQLMNSTALGTNTTFRPQNAGNLSQTTTTAEAKLIASLKLTQAETAKVWQDSIKIDYTLAIKSQLSEPVEMNMLQTPSLSTEFTYNFYVNNETDVSTQEDQAEDPLLKNKPVPRYVYLTWDTTNTVNPCPDFARRTTQEANLVNSYLNAVRGASTLSNQPMVNSFQKNLAQMQPIFRDGQSLKIVDTHDLERGFNSTSNARLFKNTATCTVNTNNVDLDTLDFNDLVLDEL